MLLAMVTASAQSRKDPLTDRQIEEVREAGDQPPERIKLFVGYVDDRAKEIDSLSKDSSAQNRALRIHNLLDEFTRLSDDLQDNMDNFDDQHADLRKILKDVVAKTTEWATVLNEPPPHPQYDFMRKSALDANRSAHDGAEHMLADEEKYFAEKKKQEKEEQKR
jgi:ABC-type transporter Mla subunit MlaD